MNNRAQLVAEMMQLVENGADSGTLANIADAVAMLRVNASFEEAQATRSRLAAAISGGYDFADTLHNVYLDYGYPQTLTFSHFWNMYRRFGIAQNVVELPVDTGWMDVPEVKAGAAFLREFEDITKRLFLWNRLKGLDTRQRVGRYAGMFMRVRDSRPPNQPIAGKLGGPAALVQMVPLHEGQLEVVEVEQDATKDNFGLPKMYRYNSSGVGGRNEKSAAAFDIHPDRIIIAAEGADTGDIYGIPALEAPYNSLMDLRKIIGAGGEGFYKNAAQSVVFKLTDPAAAKANETRLAKFNESFDDFAHNRMRRAMWTPGLDPKVLESSLANPKEFFDNALNDVAAACKIPATILIGQQTGRLASGEDSRHFLSMANSRRANFQSELVRDVFDWMIKWGVLRSDNYEIEWPDLLARSDEEKLGNAETMAKINQVMFQAGESLPFTSEEVREAAGFDPEEMPEGEIPSEGLPVEDEGMGGPAGEVE